MLASGFDGSTSRPKLFQGLTRYKRAWEIAEAEVGVSLLKYLWIGGGFTSWTMEPGDIDVSPILDREALDGLKGKPGVGKVKALFEQRDKVKAAFGVEPFVVLWSPFTSLDLRRHTVGDHEYVAVRGMMDDFWQRTVSGSMKQAMLERDAEPRRGYLEVVGA